MLMQLIKISQRIDATSTTPAVKDIVFLVVTYYILSYFIDNALDLVSRHLRHLQRPRWQRTPVLHKSNLLV